MFRSESLMSARSLALFLALIALTLSFAAPAPAAAGQSARVYNVSASVPVQNLVVHPPGPCSEEIQLAGNFAIEAHIVIPPGPPVTPEKMQVHLRLVADGITGTGMTTGETYEGRAGGDAGFHFDAPNADFPFQAAFNLHGSNPSHPPSPCRAQVNFSVSLAPSQDLSGAPTLNAVLSQDSLDN